MESEADGGMRPTTSTRSFQRKSEGPKACTESALPWNGLTTRRGEAMVDPGDSRHFIDFGNDRRMLMKIVKNLTLAVVLATMGAGLAARSLSSNTRLYRRRM